MVRTTARRRVARLTLSLLLTSAFAIAGGTSAMADTSPAKTPQPAGEKRETYPVPYSLVGGFFANPAAGLNPNTPPPGANDWDCTPSPEHPEPVVLLHGLGANQGLNWSTMSPLLANNGYCVFSLTYGNHSWLPSVGGLKSMPDSARDVSAFVDRVLRETGAKQVDLVGHSQGSTVGAYYLKKLGGADKVDKLVGISPNYGGTELYGLTKLAQHLPPLLNAVLESTCKSCKEYSPESSFIKELNSGGTAAVPGVTYTNVQGALEQIVVPNRNGTLDAPNATNVRVNDGCAIDLSDHISLVASKRMGQLLLNALDPANAAPLPCAANPPFLN